jgi:undecaprenyl-diphosphatase
MTKGNSFLMGRDRIVTEDRYQAKPASGLRVPGLFAQWPIIGLAMFLIGSLAFGALAFNVKTHGPLLQWDVPLYKRLYGDATKESARTLELWTFGFFVGKELIEVLVVILSVYFIYKRYWPELGMILIGAMGAALVWSSLMLIFNRPRPPAQVGVVVSNIPSFPSGHAMSAVVFYGFLAYLLIPKMPSLVWKWVVAIVTLLVIAYIGYSRVFEGGHYLSDILAGYALGIAWAGLVYTVIESLFMRRRTSS